MSKAGQIFRGELYHQKLGVDGHYPKEYEENPTIMEEIKIYLDSTKDSGEKRVEPKEVKKEKK